MRSDLHIWSLKISFLFCYLYNTFVDLEKSLNPVVLTDYTFASLVDLQNNNNS